METKKRTEDIKEKLLLWQRNRKKKSRVFINFGFGKKTAGETNSKSESILQHENKVENILGVIDHQKNCVDAIGDTKETEGQIITTEKEVEGQKDEFDFYIPEIAGTFMVPMIMSEEDLLGPRRDSLTSPRTLEGKNVLESTSQFLTVLDLDFLSLIDNCLDEDEINCCNQMSCKDDGDRLYDCKERCIEANDDTKPWPDLTLGVILDSTKHQELDSEASREESIEALIRVLKDNLETSQITDSSSILEECHILDDVDDSISICSKKDNHQVDTSFVVIQDNGSTENAYLTLLKNRLLVHKSDLEIFNEGCVDHKEEQVGIPNCTLEAPFNIYKPDVLILSRHDILRRIKFSSRISEHMHNSSAQTDLLLTTSNSSVTVSDTVQLKGGNVSPMLSKSFQDNIGHKDGDRTFESSSHWSGAGLESSGKWEHLERWFKSDSKTKSRGASLFGDSSLVERSDTASVADLSLPDHEEIARWKLEKLAELESKKIEIMNMCLKDIKLMYLQNEERELKSRLKKVRSKMKLLENEHSRNESSSSLGKLSQVHSGFSIAEALGHLDERSEIHASTNYSVQCMTPPERDIPSMIRDQNSLSEDLPGPSVRTNAKNSSCTMGLDVLAPFCAMKIKELHAFVFTKEQKTAAEKLCSTFLPILKGVLVRRLFQCNRVRALVITIKDTKKELDELDQGEEYSRVSVSKIDSAFKDGLKRQLVSSRNEFFEIFFDKSPEKRLAILAQQRVLNQNNKDQSSMKQQKRLSIVTKKFMEKKSKMRELKFKCPATPQEVSPTIDQQSGCPSNVDLILGSRCRVQHNANIIIGGLHKICSDKQPINRKRGALHSGSRVPSSNSSCGSRAFMMAEKHPKFRSSKSNPKDGLT